MRLSNMILICILLLGVSVWAGDPNDMRDDPNSMENDPNSVREFQYLLELAEAGEADCQFRLFFHYKNGKGVKHDLEKGVSWLEKAAEQKHLTALLIVSSYYQKGRGVEKDSLKAIEWLKQQARLGVANSYQYIGEIYLCERDVGPDIAEAKKWFMLAEDKDVIWGKYWLGIADLFEDDFKYEYDTAVEKIRIAAEKGDAVSQYKMGLIYYYGIGRVADGVKAFPWLEKAAEQGYFGAQFLAGNRVFIKRVDNSFDGLNFTTKKEAIGWLTKAYEQGCAAAASELAMLETGVYGYLLGEKPDKKLYVDWLVKAANCGSISAYWMLGSSFSSGVDVAKDDSEAYKWYKKGAELGSSMCQGNIGAMYFEGEYVEQDYEIAYKWLKKAADGGDEDAKYYLGKMYYEGIVVEKDYDKAFDYLYAAATWGSRNKEAGRLVGYMYNNGLGVEKNEKFGEYWIEKCK